MRNSTPTMRDVANHAGVSVQTVSCVINETGNISDETRSRVQRSIEALNYKRNAIARSMRTRRTRMIALLVMDITNPVLSAIASTVEAAAYARNYTVLLYNTGLDPAREQDYVDSIGDRRADGVIMVNAIGREHALQLVKNRIPTVIIDSVTDSPLPTVSVDNFRGAYLATEHLISLGHRRIAHIAGSPRLEVARQREAGYFAALADHNLGYQQSMPSDRVQWGYEHGYTAMRDLLQHDPRPTAVFAASDDLAIGAYRALAEAGLRVPEDMSVVGFDNTEAAAYTTPPLTTIHQPFAELGERAFLLLLGILENENATPANVVLPPELVARGSTAEAKTW